MERDAKRERSEGQLGPGNRTHGRGATALRPGASRERRRRVTKATLVGCLAATVLAAPGPPAERPSHLVIAPEVRARLDVLATALHREIVLCLLGRSAGGTARVDDLHMPVPHSSTPTAVVSGPCPRGTLATWHNHPTASRSAASVGTPAGAAARALPAARSSEDGSWGTAVDGGSCRPSDRDVRTAVQLRIPFLVISDGGGSHCIWPLERLETLAP